MGTDIHGGFIKHNPETNTTEPVKTIWEQNRNYLLFAVLADVRNGFGFAGSYRHEPIKPITSQKGLPDWIEMEEEVCNQLFNPWYGSPYGSPDESEMGAWLGDHSQTYMTVKEILDWDGWEATLSQGGYVELDHYKETLDQGKSPETWCGGVSGGNVLKITEDAFNANPTLQANPPQKIYVQARWVGEETIKEMLQSFYDEVSRIAKEHGDDTYLVIGFDS